MTRSPQPIRIGALGASRVAVRALVEPAKGRGDIVLAAVAARDLDRAEAYAGAYGFERALGSYQALIDDPDIDVIYNGLPPARHADLTIAALKAGKAVLCEKPFAMTVEEARAMVAAAEESGLLLMEAFHYRYHPMFERIVGIVRSGELGPIRRMEAVFEVPIANKPGELRYDPGLGGGALMDLGTYPLHWCRTVAGGEPVVKAAHQRMHEGGADMATAADLSFPGGVSARISCAMEGERAVTFEVDGDKGRLYAVNPVNPQTGNLLTVEVEGEERSETFTRETTYHFQLEAFLTHLRAGTQPPTSGTDSVAQMAAIEAIRAAARP
jgi:predicted dehydrogenase